MATVDELLMVQSDETAVVWTAVDGYAQTDTTQYDDADVVEIDHEGNISSTISAQLFNHMQSNSQYVLFQRERYADGIDLAGSGMSIGIGYLRADGVFGRTLAVNVMTSDTDLIRYGWIVPADATSVQGVLRVASNITGTNYAGNAYVLTDLYATLTVHDSVLSGDTIPVTEPSWYESFTQQMENYLSQAKAAVADKQDKLIAGKNITIAADGKTISAAGGSGSGATEEQVEQINANTAAIEKLQYGQISVTSFTASPSTAEIGSTQDIVLEWTTDKTPDSQTLNGSAVTGTSHTDADVSSDRSYTLSAVGKNNTASGTVSVSFLPKLYYGAAEIPDSVDSAFLLTLSGTLKSSRAVTFTGNAETGQYLWYALPLRYGTPIFTVGGFSGGFSEVTGLSHTNASGYTETYNVYRSVNAGLGSTTVTVS